MQKRQVVWDIYRYYLDRDTLQSMPENHIPAILSIKIKDDSIERFAKCQIQTRRWYYPPLDKHPAFIDIAKFSPQANDYLPITENLNLLGIPFHTSLTEADIIYICKQL